MLQKLLILSLLFLTAGQLLHAQSSDSSHCNIQIRGRVIDEHDRSALDFASVYIIELERGILADSSGRFNFSGLCPGRYTFRTSHVGCEPRDTVIHVYSNLSVHFFLEHHAEELATTVISGQQPADHATDIGAFVKSRDLRDPSKDLGQLLTNISGVSNLQTGPTLFKPIIHGLHSDRVLIVSNGIRLEGQSWGAEHAPELDASSAQSIQVVKGAGAVEYGADAVGGVITLKFADPDFRKDWGGQINTSFSTNNTSTALHGRLHKGWQAGENHRLAIQAGSSLKRSGDAQAPKYVLSNTGAEEYSGYGLFSWKWTKGARSLLSQTLYSFYYRNTGILAASHIGNIEDLEIAIQSDRPLIIRDRTYKIGLPRQQVVHHTFKQSLVYIVPIGRFRFQYDLQSDNRQEYDNRRNGRSEIPALDLLLQVHHLSASYQKDWKNYRLSSGTDYYYKDNRNVPGTGFRPIVPDYLHHVGALWLHNRWQKEKWTMEAGFRYEHQQFTAYRFNSNNELEKPRYTYNNAALIIGSRWQISREFNWASTLGWATRSPNASELFSSGVHQSAAAIEYGDSQLRPEKSVKWVNEFHLQWGQKAALKVSPYLSYIRNYIYLEPQQEYEITIRGAFPVFRYRQQDVLIPGLDAELSFYPIIDFIKLEAQYSFIRMSEPFGKYDLPGTPPNRLKLGAGIERSAWGKLENVYLGLNWTYVGEQFHVNPDIDFAPPPLAYHLLNLDCSAEWRVKSRRMGAGLQAINLTNSSYRDYLDRFRYFSDSQGINFTFKWFYIF